MGKGACKWAAERQSGSDQVGHHMSSMPHSITRLVPLTPTVPISHAQRKHFQKIASFIHHLSCRQFFRYNIPITLSWYCYRFVEESVIWQIYRHQSWLPFPHPPWLGENFTVPDLFERLAMMLLYLIFCLWTPDNEGRHQTKHDILLQ